MRRRGKGSNSNAAGGDTKILLASLNTDLDLLVPCCDLCGLNFKVNSDDNFDVWRILASKD